MNFKRIQFIGALCALFCATFIARASQPTALVSWGHQVIPLVDKDTRFKAIAAGGSHNLAITTRGTVVAWGYNYRPADNYPGTSQVPVGLSDVVAVAAGDAHSVALTGAGTVVTWGAVHGEGEEQPAGLTNVTQIAAGYDHTLALKADGTVVSWGYGMNQIPPGVTNIIAIAAGYKRSAALKSDGTVLFWGGGIPGLRVVASNIVAITHSYGLKSDGTVVAYVLPPPPLDTVPPIAAPPAGLSNVVAIAAGMQNPDGFAHHALALKSDGTVVTWKTSELVYPGSLDIPAALQNVSAIAAGFVHGLALKSDGTLAAWGDSSYVQGLVPADFYDTIAVSSGLALKQDGTVLAFGSSWGGVITAPPGLSNVIAVATGNEYRMALKSDGKIVAWGKSLTDQDSVINNLTNATAIAAGYDHALALDTTGNVWMWGSNAHGERNMPTGLSNVVAIAAGSRHSVALKADGTAVAWGAFTEGMNQILTNHSDIVAIDSGIAFRANGTTVQFGLAVGLPVSSDVVAISSSNGHQLALRQNGGIIAGGSNNRGECEIPPLSRPVVAIEAAESTSYAIVLIEPAIRTRVAGGNLVLSWPIAVGAYVLQSSANFLDGDSWSNVAGDVVVENDLNTITLPVSGEQRFFRLVSMED